MVTTTRQVRTFAPQTTPSATSNALNDLLRSAGPGTIVHLLPNTTYQLHSPIRFFHPNQELSTFSYPRESESYARIVVAGPNQSVALDVTGQDDAVLRNLYIEGNREELGWIEGGGALVIVGGNGVKEPTVQDCILRDPRGWSCLHAVDWCVGAKILNNLVGPAGQPAPKGPWADGLSLACKDGLVVGNTIIDATDGGIVVFCAPGTIVASNTVVSRTRTLLGGINLVDPFPFEADYTNTRVLNNRIVTETSEGYIKLGIGIGETCWGDNHNTRNYGGTVSGNIIGPGKFGYGIALAGCRDFTVLHNTINHDTTFCGDTAARPTNCPPVPFLKTWDPDWALGEFQPEFVEGEVGYLIGIEKGFSRSLRFPNNSLPSEVRVQGGWLGIEDGELKLVDLSPDGKSNTVWSTRSEGKVQNWQFKGGVLIAHNKEGEAVWDSWKHVFGRNSTPGHGRETFTIERGRLMINDAAQNVIWMNRYFFPLGWRLNAGQWIALPSSTSLVSPESETPTLLPSRRGPIFFTLLPNGHLVLHFSVHPLQPRREEVIWTPPNWKQVQADGDCFCSLQGDGNLVIYKAGEAVWASGTNGEGDIGKVGCLEVGREGIMLSAKGGARWKSWDK
ncbi:hypothetical protein BT69DRAFT_1356832 [Atractiella rhizophila]|nr:hypothetical protein BT69DRAFT_1356832 [Atractiella rhizophila]